MRLVRSQCNERKERKVSNERKNQHDIVQDISFRRRRFELKLLSSNNSVIKLLHARS